MSSGAPLNSVMGGDSFLSDKNARLGAISQTFCHRDEDETPAKTPLSLASGLLPREMEDSCSRLALVQIGPFLREMVLILQQDLHSCVVPVLGSLHSRHADQGKCQDLVLRIRDCSCGHLRLIPGGTVMRCQQVVSIHRKHGHHNWTFGWAEFLHQRGA